ncbi:hypothetical protein RJ55_05030 [Drechmeria coniospora]|nr:hypothetical protein RJ55_05030 [Drechmeria coniospora]
MKTTFSTVGLLAALCCSGTAQARPIPKHAMGVQLSSGNLAMTTTASLLSELPKSDEFYIRVDDRIEQVIKST